MRARASDEQGFVLATAIMLTTVVLGLGLGLLLLTDGQQRAAGREQATESAFDLAEAALNAQVGQLSRSWPAKEGEALPDVKTNGVVRCTASTSTATNGCPTSESLSAGYSNLSTGSCPTGAATEAWGSPLTNPWTTYVRDNESKESTVFNPGVEQKEPGYDGNEDGKVWVRSVGVVQCHWVTLITLVSRQQVALNFPHDALSGNWFEITNNGKKVIVNTAGESTNPVSQPGEISMRCEGLGAQPCESWSESKEQISPNTTKAPANPSPLLSAELLAGQKAQAQAAGTFHSGAAGTCPKSTAETSGLPAYVEGCGDLKLTGGVGNSSASPGFLVIADGTLELLGNAEFFGAIYAVNPTNLSSAIVKLGGTSQVIGAIDVDGKGGIELGSSKANLIFDPRGILGAKSYAGATPTRNSFRVLPEGQ
jgi:Tfp pilus assembly protein PilX